MALLDELLTEKTRRYRRNVMAVSFIAIAVWWADNIAFSEAKLFGIGFDNKKLNVDAASAEQTFWWVMLLLFFYQSVGFAQSVWADYKIWFRATRRIIREFDREDATPTSSMIELPPKVQTAETERDVRLRQFKLWDVLVPGITGLIALFIMVCRLWHLT